MSKQTELKIKYEKALEKSKQPKTNFAISGKSDKRESYFPKVRKANPDKDFHTSQIEMPNYVEEVKKMEAESWGYRQLLNPEMLKDYGDPSVPENLAKYPKWTDPRRGIECHARIVSVKWLETTAKKIKGKISTTIEAHYISPQDLLEKNIKLKESLGPKRRRLVEAVEYSWAQGNDNPGEGGPLGFSVAYPPGPFTRQLYLQDMWNMMSRAFYLYNHYGIAKSAVNTISYFVIGEGVKIDMEDDKAQAVWDEFYERTHLDRDLQTYCMMLSVNGELIFHLPAIKVNGESGFTDLISVDPGTCWEIITEPKDIRKVKAYWIQYPTQYQLYSVGGVPISDYVIEQLKPEEVIHVKVNVQKNEKRGRSDLLASLADLKMLQDINQYRSVRIINEAALVFDQKITGNDTDVSAIAGIQTGFLGAGTTYTHNESSELEIKSASMSATSKSGFTDEMLAQIGTGVASMPAEFIGGGSGSNRANALTKTEPSYKSFRARQKLFEYTIKDMAKIVIQNHNTANVGEAPLAWKCEVIFPEIAPEDRKDKMANIVLMESQEYWDHEKAATVAAKEMDDTSYDYEDTQETIKQERLADPQLAFLFQPQAPGVIGSAPNIGAAPPGSNAPKPATPPAQPKLGSPAPTSQYGTNSMGMGSSTKKSIKTQMKQQSESLVFEKEKHSLHKGSKAGHKMIKGGLRSRTSHTVQGEEAMGAGSMPAQMRMSVNDLGEMYKKLETDKHPYLNVDWKESTPPGWEQTTLALKKHKGISNPYALVNYMDSQGYKPSVGKSKK
jgi:hypothetical protein